MTECMKRHNILKQIGLNRPYQGTGNRISSEIIQRSESSLPRPFIQDVVRRRSWRARQCTFATPWWILSYWENCRPVTQGGPLNPRSGDLTRSNCAKRHGQSLAGDKLKGRENTGGRSVKNDSKRGRKRRSPVRTGGIKRTALKKNEEDRLVCSEKQWE